MNQGRNTPQSQHVVRHQTYGYLPGHRRLLPDWYSFPILLQTGSSARLSGLSHIKKAYPRMRLFCSCLVCCCCVRFSFFSTTTTDWLRRTSPKWPILCRVGCKTLTQSINQSNTVIKKYVLFENLSMMLLLSCIISTDRAFAAARPRLWNSLPTHVRRLDLSLDTFCCNLKTVRGTSDCCF